ncbi:MAG: hypothetical protein K2Z81_26410 [Cyanobacteria bacterium]|nr:hypothetical protein [Cyanobacteriota bacterium]
MGGILALVLLGVIGFLFGVMRERSLPNNLLIVALWGLPALLLHNFIFVPLVVGYLAGWGFLSLQISRIDKS